MRKSKAGHRPALRREGRKHVLKTPPALSRRFSPHLFKRETLQVFGFGNHRGNRVVGRLRVSCHTAQNVACGRRRSKQRDGILPDERIGRGERQRVRLCLANEHPVEGIAVQRGQSAQLRDGDLIQGQRRDEMFFALLWDELRWRLWQRQFAKAVLDGEFSERNGAQEYLIVRVAYRSGNISRQLGVAGHEPEEFTGVQQDFHLPSNACKTSSGSGALKSSGATNWPLARPPGRGCVSDFGRRIVSRPELFSGRLSAPLDRTCP